MRVIRVRMKRKRGEMEALKVEKTNLVVDEFERQNRALTEVPWRLFGVN